MEHEAFPLRDTWRLNNRRVGREVLVYFQLDSTNNRAAQAGIDGLAVLADEQTAGRGQHGRSWQALPRSSVLLSVLLYPPEALARPVILTAWAAVSVCRAVQRLTGCLPRIKWPNDVLLAEKKVCGILIEQSSQGSRPATVAGIGLNVQQSAGDFARADLPLATSLCQHCPHPLDTDEVARQLLGQLDEEYDRLCQGARTTLEASWLQYLGLVGKDVVAECPIDRYPGRLVEAGFDRLVLNRPGAAPLLLTPETILHLDPA
jgi:BirA family biotin operon repressor/biotin-[acetyl-CoA-carboxylase] ligase